MRKLALTGLALAAIVVVGTRHYSYDLSASCRRQTAFQSWFMGQTIRAASRPFVDIDSDVATCRPSLGRNTWWTATDYRNRPPSGVCRLG